MIQAGRAASLFATAMLAAMTFPPLRLSASDCNGNSIEDSLELSGPFFTPQTLGGFPTSLLAAAVPLDGDRHVDLVVLSLGNGDGTWLHLLRSDGEGGFVPSDERRTMRNGWFFLAEDMDMDGDKDLVLLNGDSTLSLRRNDGSGSFSVEEETGIVIAPPSSLIAADFDKDGDPDLAAGRLDSPAGTLTVILNNGPAGLRRVSVKAGGGQASIASGDFNGDGFEDLAAVGVRSIVIIPNEGNGVFGDPREAVQGSFADVAAGDLNGDGLADLLASGSNLRLFLGERDGSFREADPVLDNFSPGKPELADLDGDGDLDAAATRKLAVGGQGPGSRALIILWNDGRGNLHREDRFEVGENPGRPVLADLDGDGDREILAVSPTSGVMILRNLGGATYDGVRSYVVGARASSLAAADIDQDGTLDLAIRDEEAISVLWNDGNGSLAQPATRYELPFDQDPFGILADDFNGDRKADLASGVTVLLNDGARSFRKSFLPQGRERTSLERSADLDRDGDLDILGFSESGIALLENDGAGAFTHRHLAALSGERSAMEVADLNKDGWLDVAVGHDDQLIVLTGEESFGLAAPKSYEMRGRLYRLAAADLDDDGHLDLAGLTGSSLVVMWNDGLGEFHAATTFSAGGTSLVPLDYDADGRTDLAIAAGGLVATFRNLGGRTLERHVFLRPAIDSVDILAVQLDGRAGLDLAVSGRQGTVTLFFSGQAATRDCNGDGIPDACQLGANDCNRNDIPDDCDLREGQIRFAQASYPVNMRSQQVVTADVDGDGIDDVASAAEAVITLWRNEGVAGFAPIETVEIGDLTTFILADVTGDGARDLLACADDRTSTGPDAALDGLYILRNVAGWTFAPATRYPCGRSPAGLAAKDLDADGDLDLVVANRYAPIPAVDNGFAGEISIFRNGGHGVFEPIRGIDTGEGTFSVRPADLDGDGDEDILANTVSGVLLFPNDGEGTFSLGRKLLASPAVAASAGDLDGDGDLDLLVTELGRVTALRNLGNGSFLRNWAYTSTEIIVGATLDVDADGDLDLALTDVEACCEPFAGNLLRVLLNDGSGKFKRSWSRPLPFSSLSIHVMDADGMGGLDLLVPLPGETIVFSNRTPSFLVTDCDGNGRLDECDPDGDGDGVTDSCDLCPGLNDRTDDNRDGNPDCFGASFDDLILGGSFRWFVRGDSDENGATNLLDAIFTLNYLFRAKAPLNCLRSHDANDDGAVNIADPMYTLQFLFLGGAPIPHPHPDCGRDLEPDGLTCGAYLPCGPP